MTDSNRGSFGSKIGLILATAGGAVGLGNVWRFPYMAGQEGGAAFILVYICLLDTSDQSSERPPATQRRRADTRDKVSAYSCLLYTSRCV